MSEQPTWVCEYCYRTDDHAQLPDGWELVLQSAICDQCIKLGVLGKIQTLVGGALANGRKDPRAKPITKQPTCETCRWWKPSFAGNIGDSAEELRFVRLGGCHANAPVPRYDVTDLYKSTTVWPQMEHDDFCRKHKPNSEEKPKHQQPKGSGRIVLLGKHQVGEPPNQPKEGEK